MYDAGYLSSLNRPNVRLVTDPIAKVVGDGVILKSGEKVELDVLVYATGFDTVRSISSFLSGALS